MKALRMSRRMICFVITSMIIENHFVIALSWKDTYIQAFSHIGHCCHTRTYTHAHKHSWMVCRNADSSKGVGVKHVLTPKVPSASSRAQELRVGLMDPTFVEGPTICLP